jgi:transcriptional regulator with XRE-family HTH domain
MIENNLKNLGAAIREVRVRLNITQKELAEGICSQSEISKIESGVISPYVHTLVKISKKLGIDPSYFLKQLYKDQYEFISHAKSLIREAIKKKDYKEVRRLINKYQLHPSFQDVEEKQFITWHKGVVTFYLDHDDVNAIKLLNEALNMKDSIQATEQDIQILNSMAIIFCEKEQWKKAEEVFRQAEEIYKKSLFITDFTIYIRLCYNLSKMLYSLERYKEGLKKCEKGIELCKSYESNYLFGELLYQKGIILIKMGKREEGIKYLEKSLFIFELLGKESYLKLVQEKINQYHQNI